MGMANKIERLVDWELLARDNVFEIRINGEQQMIGRIDANTAGSIGFLTNESVAYFGEVKLNHYTPREIEIYDVEKIGIGNDYNFNHYINTGKNATSDPVSNTVDLNGRTYKIHENFPESGDLSIYHIADISGMVASNMIQVDQGLYDVTKDLSDVYHFVSDTESQSSVLVEDVPQVTLQGTVYEITDQVGSIELFELQRTGSSVTDEQWIEVQGDVYGVTLVGGGDYDFLKLGSALPIQSVAGEIEINSVRYFLTVDGNGRVSLKRVLEQSGQIVGIQTIRVEDTVYEVTYNSTSDQYTFTDVSTPANVFQSNPILGAVVIGSKTYEIEVIDPEDNIRLQAWGDSGQEVLSHIVMIDGNHYEVKQVADEFTFTNILNTVEIFTTTGGEIIFGPTRYRTYIDEEGFIQMMRLTDAVSSIIGQEIIVVDGIEYQVTDVGGKLQLTDPLIPLTPHLEDAQGQISLPTGDFFVRHDVPEEGKIELHRLALISQETNVGTVVRVDGIVYQVNVVSETIEFQSLDATSNAGPFNFSESVISIAGNDYLIEYQDTNGDVQVDLSDDHHQFLLTEAPRTVDTAESTVQTLWAEGKFYDVVRVVGGVDDGEFMFTNVLNSLDFVTSGNQEVNLGTIDYLVIEDPATGHKSIIRPRTSSTYRENVLAIQVGNRVYEYSRVGGPGTAFTFVLGTAVIPSTDDGTFVTIENQTFSIEVIDEPTLTIHLAVIPEDADQIFEQIIEMNGVEYGVVADLVEGVPTGHYFLLDRDPIRSVRTDDLATIEIDGVMYRILTSEVTQEIEFETMDRSQSFGPFSYGEPEVEIAGNMYFISYGDYRDAISLFSGIKSQRDPEEKFGIIFHLGDEIYDVSMDVLTHDIHVFRRLGRSMAVDPNSIVLYDGLAALTFEDATETTVMLQGISYRVVIDREAENYEIQTLDGVTTYGPFDFYDRDIEVDGQRYFMSRGEAAETVIWKEDPITSVVGETETTLVLEETGYVVTADITLQEISFETLDRSQKYSFSFDETDIVINAKKYLIEYGDFRVEVTLRGKKASLNIDGVSYWLLVDDENQEIRFQTLDQLTTYGPMKFTDDQVTLGNEHYYVTMGGTPEEMTLQNKKFIFRQGIKYEVEDLRNGSYLFREEGVLEEFISIPRETVVVIRDRVYDMNITKIPVDLIERERVDITGDGYITDEDEETIQDMTAEQVFIDRSDLNQDGRVDRFDYHLYADNKDGMVDVNEDGLVNMDDYAKIIDTANYARNTYYQNKALELDSLAGGVAKAFSQEGIFVGTTISGGGEEYAYLEDWLGKKLPDDDAGELNNGRIEIIDVAEFELAYEMLQFLTDMNADGKIDEADVTYMEEFLDFFIAISKYKDDSGSLVPSVIIENMDFADVNRDGLLTAADRAMIQKSIAQYASFDLVGNDDVVNIADVKYIEAIVNLIRPENGAIDGWKAADDYKSQVDFNKVPNFGRVYASKEGARITYEHTVEEGGDYYVGISVRPPPGQYIPEDFRYKIDVELDGEYAGTIYSYAIDSRRFEENRLLLQHVEKGTHNVKFIFRNISSDMPVQVQRSFMNTTGFNLSAIDVNADGLFWIDDRDALSDLIAKYDSNKNGYLMMVAGDNDEGLLPPEDRAGLLDAIQHFDFDGNGRVDKEDVKEVADVAYWFINEKMLEEKNGYRWDFNDDGRIDLDDRMFLWEAARVRDLTGDGLLNQDDLDYLIRIKEFIDLTIQTHEMRRANVNFDNTFNFWTGSSKNKFGGRLESLDVDGVEFTGSICRRSRIYRFH